MFEIEKNHIECKGIIFRANVTHYVTGINIGQKIRLRQLKRKSCPGCNKCRWIYDQIEEVNEDWPIIGIDKVKNGKLYTITVTNIGRDFETGLVDEWDLAIVEWKE